MVYHIVLFTFYDNASQEKIKELADALAVLSKKIPGITHYVWGAISQYRASGKSVYTWIYHDI